VTLYVTTSRDAPNDAGSRALVSNTDALRPRRASLEDGTDDVCSVTGGGCDSHDRRRDESDLARKWRRWTTAAADGATAAAAAAPSSSADTVLELTRWRWRDLSGNSTHSTSATWTS